MDSTHTLFKSIYLWCFAQVTWFAGILNIGNLEFIFKFLSIISVLMVIVINGKKFVNAVKGFFRKRKQ